MVRGGAGVGAAGGKDSECWKAAAFQTTKQNTLADSFGE
jgi:hypothetical protein